MKKTAVIPHLLSRLTPVPENSGRNLGQAALFQTSIGRSVAMPLVTSEGEGSMVMQILANGTAVVAALVFAHRSAPEGLIVRWRGQSKRSAP